MGMFDHYFDKTILMIKSTFWFLKVWPLPSCDLYHQGQIVEFN